MLELLSPAGNIGAFKAAVEAGANAVYMGLKEFNARTMANNFELQEYMDCIAYAHERNVKVYLTLNTLLTDQEMEQALKLVLELYANGLDAVIVQDIGLFTLIHQVVPELAIHASTQMSVVNLDQVKFLEKLGFKRVVLARELTLEEIEFITKNTKIQIEIFVHGALCVSVSGQCYLSSMIGERSANRGKCAATCRMKYDLLEDSKKIGSGYLISKKDIYGLDIIPKLQEMGVTSVKIEGRNKPEEYVALTTSEYRKKIDGICDPEAQTRLLQIFNRGGKSDGYFTQVGSKDTISGISAKNMGLYLGKVMQVKKEYIQVRLKQDIDLRDGIEVYSDGNVVSTIVTCIQDEKRMLVNKKVQAETIVWLGDIKEAVKEGDEIYKTSSFALNETYKKYASSIVRKTVVPIAITIKKDQPVFASWNGQKISISYIPEQAKSIGVDQGYLETAFAKTSEQPFTFLLEHVEIHPNLYVPMAKLNELRRAVLEVIHQSFFVTKEIADKQKLLNKLLKDHQAILDRSTTYLLQEQKGIVIYQYEEDQLSSYLSSEYTRIYVTISEVYRFPDMLEKCKGKDLYLILPNVMFRKSKKYIEENLEKLVKEYGIKGLVIENYGLLDECRKLKEKYNIELIAGNSLNITNSFSAQFLKDQGLDRVTLPMEQFEIQEEKIASVLKIEKNKEAAIAMTSRFCPIKAFTGGCNCSKHSYLLKDVMGVNYSIIPDTLDCAIKLIREYRGKFVVKNGIKIR